MRHRGAVLLLTGLLCAFGMSSAAERASSQALRSVETLDTPLGRGLGPMADEHPGLSGIVALPDPVDAFAVRMRLAQVAQRSLDVQYYIWRDDITGGLLLQALMEAAQRGVRVRLLLDDNGVDGLDDALGMLDALPHAEVRLFNPFPFRRFKPLGFLTDFGRVNRRMHNKSFTTDGQLTVVGGRNIGDEYFGATQGVAFADLDVLAAGAVVDEVGADFDRYWNSVSAFPLGQLATPPSARRQLRLHEAARVRAATPQAQTYAHAVAQSRYIDYLRSGQLSMEWARVRMVSDDPGKVLGRAARDTLLLPRLTAMLGEPEQSIDLVSPYFVPTERGVQAFSAMVRSGVRVRILTNALEATDVTAVHAGYAKSRVPLLAQGVSLYEMRRDGERRGPRETAGPFGSSGSSLHAKTFAVDGQRVFVGSFNFDPRSAQLNTELGFVIESRAMAQTMSALFDAQIPRHAYALSLDGEGRLQWLAQDSDGSERRLRREPSSSWWRLAWVRVLSWLPIDGLL